MTSSVVSPPPAAEGLASEPLPLAGLLFRLGTASGFAFLPPSGYRAASFHRVCVRACLLFLAGPPGEANM